MDSALFDRFDFLRSPPGKGSSVNAPAPGETPAIVEPAGEPEPPPAPPNEQLEQGKLSEREAFLASMHSKLVAVLKPDELAKMPAARQREFIIRTAEMLIDTQPGVLSGGQRRLLVNELLDEVLGFGSLERLLADPSISDILINGASKVYVERQGKLEPASIRFRDDNHLLEIIRRMVAKVGRRVDESSPMVDARLADGSRINAIVPPLSLSGPMLSIRRFGTKRLTLDDLIALRALMPAMGEFLGQAVRAKRNIVVSGGTGSGKTTLLNCLSAFIPTDERIITIEDAAELQLQQEHVGILETRPPNVEGKGAVSIRDLLRNALRMRPNRIIIGECRGPEALDMLQAMNTGHEGSMTTLHANTPRDALTRLEMMILMAGLDLPLSVIRRQIASSIHLIVQVSRLPGGPRRVTSISEVIGCEGDTITMQELFRFRQLGINEKGIAFGRFESTGLASHHIERITSMGGHLSRDLFAERILGDG